MGPSNALLMQIAQGADPRMADAMAQGYRQGNAMLQMRQAQEDRNALAQIAQAYGQGGPQAAREAASQLGQFDATVGLDNTLYGRGRDASNDAFRDKQFQYGIQRDQIGDQRWNKNFEADQDWRNWQKSNARKSSDPMAAFQTRAQAAQMLGLDPNSTDFQSYVLTGKVPSQGQGQKPTVDSAKAAGFYIRMQDADSILSNPENVAASVDRGNRAIDAVTGAMPLGIGRGYVDPKFQMYDQAKRDFINAVLRRESGAVISDSEFENANVQYFPQPGDSPQVIQQKAQNRRNAIQGVYMAGEPSLKGVQGAIGVEALGGSGDWIDMGNGVRVRQKGQ